MTLKTRAIRLRPHHLLCLLAFKGEGYSPEFIERAKRLQRSWLEDGTVVEVVEGLDELCTDCPELSEECVSTTDDAGAYQLDRAAASFLDVELGPYRSDDLLRLIRSNFVVERCYEVCNGCSWLPRIDCPRIIRDRLNGKYAGGDPTDG